VLYLFGTPGQDRFWFPGTSWHSARSGPWCWPTSRRLADLLPVDRLLRAAPDAVPGRGELCFDGDQRFQEGAVRDALDLDPDVPIIFCDARNRASAKNVLVSLVEHVLVRQQTEPVRAPPPIGQLV